MRGRTSPIVRTRDVVPSIALLFALAATAIVNPYGFRLPRDWLETLTMPLPSLIDEHARLSLGEPIGWATVALAIGYLAALVGVFPRRPRIVWLLPLVWLVLAAVRVRNAPLFAITAAIGLADMLPLFADRVNGLSGATCSARRGRAPVGGRLPCR